MPTPSSARALSVPAADAAPSFLVGRDPDGHWLAVEIHGLGGGIFRTRESACHYARDESGRAPGAVRVVDEPVTLPLFRSR